MTEPMTAKLTAAEAQLVHDRNDLDRQIKKLTADRDGIDAILRASLENKGARLGLHRSHLLVELVPWRRSTVDVKSLRAYEPEIAQRYLKESSGLTLKYVA